MGVMRYYSFSEVCALGACWQVASKNVIYGWRGKGRVFLDGGQRIMMAMRLKVKLYEMYKTKDFH